MATCVHCGKTGVLVKTDQYGLCKKCADGMQGLVRSCGLVPFWLTLDEKERDICAKAYGNTLVSGTPGGTPPGASAVLFALGKALMLEKEYNLAEKAFAEILRLNNDLQYVHDAYGELIEMYYNLRSQDIYAQRCIQYCTKYINRFKDLKKPLQRLYGGTLPPQPAFYRLATVYEQQGNYRDAIKVCNLAIKNNVRDVAKTGFKGRLERLAAQEKQK